MCSSTSLLLIGSPFVVCMCGDRIARQGDVCSKEPLRPETRARLSSALSDPAPAEITRKLEPSLLKLQN